MDSQQFTKEKTKQSKTNFYYSFLFLPKKKREAIYTVYSFCRHSDDIVDDQPSPDLARKALDNWREEVEACYKGTAQDPIMVAMMDTIQHFPIPKQYFHQLIDGVEMDLVQNRFETFEELKNYCFHVASVVGLICIEIFGYRSPQTKEYATNLGLALQLTNIIRDVGEDARNKRIYLPLEDLETYKINEKDILNETYNPPFVEMMKAQANRAQKFYDDAIQLYEKRDHHLLFPAEIMRKIYHQLLQRTIEIDYDVFQHRVRVPNNTKVMLAVQTWLASRWTRLWQWAPTS